MRALPQPIGDLFTLFKELDGRSLNGYRKLLNTSYYHDRDDLVNHSYSLTFIHIQGSSGASPASVCRLKTAHAELGLADWCLSNDARKIAAADYILRAFNTGVRAHALQNRGVQGSGSFQPVLLPPQVLKRNIVNFDDTDVHISFRVSLPVSPKNRVLGHHATEMFSHELNNIIDTLKETLARIDNFSKHIEVVEDMLALQKQLDRYGLLAFVGDGSILPRKSGVTEAPMEDGAVAFYAPDEAAVEVLFPNAGRKRGLGIRPGVNVLIGGGFHGKSTLLNALVKGVYPHIPGDGREQVVTHADAAFVCAEDGRAVTGLDITGFIDNLPGGTDAKRFSTENASGSTSEAAAIIEAVLAGAKLLLIDEDSSATNLLIKDRNMRRLLPEDTITPLFDRVQELFLQFNVSTLIVIGGSSEYLGVAEQVIAMQNYLPVCMTDQVSRLTLAEPEKPAKPLRFLDNRRVLVDNFDPSYQVRRLGKTLSVRIKPLRLQEKVLEYGNVQLDLTKLKALVDPHQVLAIGYALFLARKIIKSKVLSPTDLTLVVYRLIEKEGFSILLQDENDESDENDPSFFAYPRRLELAGAINRLRGLKVEIADG